MASDDEEFRLEAENQLAAFTTHGFMGDGSPDRADALVWGLTELFPRVVSTGSSNLTDYRQQRGGHDRPASYLDGRNASERARARRDRGPIRATTHTRPR